MRKRKDLTGQKIGRWHILSIHHYNGHVNFYNCICECGNERTVNGYTLSSGESKSCGCWLTDLNIMSKTKHGGFGTRLYHIWVNMCYRCRVKTGRLYKQYGERGIKVCNEWLDFENFRSWAIQNGYNSTLTIDRLNSYGNFEPGNCRWATYEEQNNNVSRNVKIDINGDVKTLSQWIKHFGASKDAVYGRRRRGITGINLFLKQTK